MVPRTAIARPGVSRYGGVKEQETDSGVGGGCWQFDHTQLCVAERASREYIKKESSVLKHNV